MFNSFLLNGVHLSFWSCLIFTLYHSFWVCDNFLGLIGKKLSEGKGGNKFVLRLYYRWYVDNDTPNGDNDINDNDGDENQINDNNKNNDNNSHNDHSDYNNDSNYDIDNGDQTIMILQAIFFGEPLVCEKAEFCESAQILMRLHS